MKRPQRQPEMGFTKVLVNGSNGEGLVDLTSGSVLGPFAPRRGDQVTGIVESGGTVIGHAFDDGTGFASVVESDGKLRQFDVMDLSATPLYITFARLR